MYGNKSMPVQLARFLRYYDALTQNGSCFPSEASYWAQAQALHLDFKSCNCNFHG